MQNKTASPPQSPSTTAITSRAICLRCPRCGQGRLFSGMFRMNPGCDQCGFRFLREPGYYLGSIYMNYGLTVLVVTSSYLIGRFVAQIPAQQLLWPLLAFCLLFPLLIFRHARALWLALDCRCDPSVLDEPHDPPQA